jgi:hypothetical protein
VNGKAPGTFSRRKKRTSSPHSRARGSATFGKAVPDKVRTWFSTAICWSRTR